MAVPKYAMTSRSEIENWQKCKRSWYFRKVYGGRGIVPSYAGVPLVAGSAVHKGVESLMTDILMKRPPDVDNAVKAARANYLEAVADRQLGDTLSERQAATKREQLALCAALVRVWHKVELPRLLAEYEIVQTERSSMFRLSENPPLMFMAKADAILLNKETRHPYVYSLKTAKEWTTRSENSYSTDLQGLTESLAVMAEARTANERRAEAIRTIKAEYKSGKLSKDLAIGKIEQLGPEAIETVMGVRFCFLIKGKRWPLYDADGNKNGMWTDSPFLYGYRRVGPGFIEYAHTNSRVELGNKSGYGKLGKGWEKFCIYDGGEASKAVGGVRGWIELLASGEVQPDMPNPLDSHVVTPTPRFPYKEELESTLVQITSEGVAAERAKLVWEESGDLDKEFPQTRRNCYWPTDCDYLHACYKATAGQDLLDPSSPYEQRTPHHDLEANMLGDGEEIGDRE